MEGQAENGKGSNAEVKYEKGRESEVTAEGMKLLPARLWWLLLTKKILERRENQEVTGGG